MTAKRFRECTREDVHRESLRIQYIICLHNEVPRVTINHSARRSTRFSTLRNCQTREARMLEFYVTSLCWHFSLSFLTVPTVTNRM